ncbi:MAG TPA: hypothetical protein VEB20_17190 [Azospirillaceae bacterium]|nr:hypothetical protein [Azospirillaceae bacterium]
METEATLPVLTETELDQAAGGSRWIDHELVEQPEVPGSTGQRKP